METQDGKLDPSRISSRRFNLQPGEEPPRMMLNSLLQDGELRFVAQHPAFQWQPHGPKGMLILRATNATTSASSDHDQTLPVTPGTPSASSNQKHALSITSGTPTASCDQNQSEQNRQSNASPATLLLVSQASQRSASPSPGWRFKAHRRQSVYMTSLDPPAHEAARACDARTSDSFL